MSGEASPRPAEGAPPRLSSFGEIERIVLLSPGFVLVPIEVPGPDLARALREWLTAAGHSTLVLEPLDDDAWATLAWRLTTIAPAPAEVVMVIGDRAPSTGVDRGLHLVNQSRDTIASRVGRPLLWCGPRPFLERTMDEAPDFWSIRAVERRLVPVADEARARGAPGLAASESASSPVPSPPRLLAPPAPAPPREAIPAPDAAPFGLEPSDHPDLSSGLDLFEKELTGDALNAARLARPVIQELLARDDVDAAEALLARAFAPIGALSDPVRSDLAILRAKIQHRRGMFDEAMHTLGEVLVDPATRADQRTTARLALAEAHSDRGDAAGAQDVYREALEGARAERDSASEARALAGLGSVAMRANPLDGAALTMLEDAYSLAQKVGDPDVRALTRRTLAGAYSAAHDERRAKGLLEMSLIRRAYESRPKLDPLLAGLLADVVDGGPIQGVAVFVTTREPSTLDRLGIKTSSRAGNIATATLSPAEIERLEADVDVLAVEKTSGARLQSTPARPQPGIGPREAMRIAGPEGEGLDGDGTILGFVDSEGLDLYHPDFWTRSGKTHVVRLWDQTIRHGQTLAGELPRPYQYGTVYTPMDIFMELDGNNRETHGIVAHRALKSSHGTAVAGIAAGAGREDERARGVAPAADIVFVNTWGSGTDALAAATEIADALHYIFTVAGDRPCVVHLGLGEDLGPRDGTSPLERFIDALLEQPGRAVVIPAGNSAGMRRHRTGQLQGKGASSELSLDLPRRENHVLIEVWFDTRGGAALAVEVCAPGPDGATGTVPPDGLARMFGVQDNRVLVVSTPRYPNSDNGLICIELSGWDGARLLPGTWTIRLTVTSNAACDWHACVKGRHVRWAGEDVSDATTITSPGTSRRAITVGACDASGKAMFFSGAGPGRGGLQKPDVVAPGVTLLVPSAATVERYYPRFTGTSAASALVAGQVALLFQRALQEGKRLTALEAQAWVRDTADHLGLSGYDPKLGFGRATAAALLPSERTSDLRDGELPEPRGEKDQRH